MLSSIRRFFSFLARGPSLSLVTCLATVVLLACSESANAQIFANLRADVRVTGIEPANNGGVTDGGNAGDENGGNTQLIVGINSGLVQNWALYGFDGIVPNGQAVTGATLTIVPNGAFTNGNHGSVEDSFNIHQVFTTNAGWNGGGQAISNNATNMANPGVVTFRQAGWTTQDWLDAGGNSVPNILGAFDATPLASTGGYDQGAEPALLTFDFDAATAQGWVDDGFADLVLSVTDGVGDNTTRYGLGQLNAALTIQTVPEPSSFVLALSCLVFFAVRRKL